MDERNYGWIPVRQMTPNTERENYVVTFINNECGYPEHGFAQWYDGEFHIPAVVIAWREHLTPYQPTTEEWEDIEKCRLFGLCNFFPGNGSL